MDILNVLLLCQQHYLQGNVPVSSSNGHAWMDVFNKSVEIG
jgi:hypothetical protein